jgi:hypothetical protein
MHPARLLLALLAILVVATSASATPAATKGPTGLHAFLFRADEPTRHEFARTPSFAWAPVPGAKGYEFQLATTDTFRENGVILTQSNLTTPVASVMLTLPWITGSPYSLYARVRAKFKNSVSEWSPSFGFNMRQPEVPKPLPSFAGVLRWTPIEGAGGYQVWLIDVNKFIDVYTNVLDEREFYTFHQSQAWTSKVRWRIRAARWDTMDESLGPRANGLPITQFGPWSPVYESTNPALDTGPIKLIGTVSDVIAKGSSNDHAHRLMPAFVFSGTKGLDGNDAELYRVYVFTDRDCLNRVFTGAVIGSPAYSARSYGPLALPRSSAALGTTRGLYLSDGDQGTTYAADGEQLTPNESLPQPTATTGLPAATKEAAPTPTPTPTTPTDETQPSTPAPSSPSSSGSVKFLTVTGDLGAPVDLWDTNWPQGGYYWTVVPVAAVAPATSSTTVAEAAAIGATSVNVASATGFATGDVVEIGNDSNQETMTITGVNANSISFATALKQGHGGGEPLVRTSGNLIYRDLELPQEVCASGRVQRFGKSSEPALVAAGTPFVSGLSPKGRLTSAVSSASSFYGSPLVAWTPALAADAYHVQWSKTRSPFRPVNANWLGKGEAAGFLTFATSAVLPLTPGTWYYRVRGVSFHLPTNAQWMGWSDPARIVVAKPTYRVGGR